MVTDSKCSMFTHIENRGAADLCQVDFVKVRRGGRGQHTCSYKERGAALATHKYVGGAIRLLEWDLFIILEGVLHRPRPLQAISGHLAAIVFRNVLISPIERPRTIRAQVYRDAC